MMKPEVGDSTFPIWLLGDSNPVRWQKELDTPLDPRHPARHSIWTPILDVAQDRIFRECRMRIDTSGLYIRNAIGNPDKVKPASTEENWKPIVADELAKLRTIMLDANPKMVLCFGAFAYEFARRARGEHPEHKYGYWGARKLGEQFRERIKQFDIEKTNIIPLLHASIARGKFIQSHEQFCGDKKGANYFDFVGTELANVILAYRDGLPIWIHPSGLLK